MQVHLSLTYCKPGEGELWLQVNTTKYVPCFDVHALDYLFMKPKFLSAALFRVSFSFPQQKSY